MQQRIHTTSLTVYAAGVRTSYVIHTVGRKLVVKEDFDVERDKFGRIIPDKSRNSGGGGGGGANRPGGPRMHDRSGGGGMGMGMMGPAPGGGGGPPGGGGRLGNTYGLSVGFLESLGIDGPLNSRLFVANVSPF